MGGGAGGESKCTIYTPVDVKDNVKTRYRLAHIDHRPATDPGGTPPLLRPTGASELLPGADPLSQKGERFLVLKLKKVPCDLTNKLKKK